MLNVLPSISIGLFVEALFIATVSRPLAASVSSRIVLQSLQTIDDVNCHRVTSPILWRHVTLSVKDHANRSEVVVKSDKDLLTRFSIYMHKISDHIRSTTRNAHDSFWACANKESHFVYTAVCTWAKCRPTAKKKPKIFDPYLWEKATNY